MCARSLETMEMFWEDIKKRKDSFCDVKTEDNCINQPSRNRYVCFGELRGIWIECDYDDVSRGQKLKGTNTHPYGHMGHNSAS